MAAAQLAGIACYLPPGRETAADLLGAGLMTERQHERLGVESVPVAGPDEHPSDLMVAAGKRLLRRLGTDARDIDLVITASAVPPEYHVRSVAARVAHHLGAERATGFDIYAGCNAFHTQIQLAEALLAAGNGVDTVLVAAGDRWAEYSDRQLATGLMFGDAGAAALLTRADRHRPAAWVPLAAHSLLDGSLSEVAGVPLGSRAARAPRPAAGPGNPSAYAICDPDRVVRDFVPVNVSRFVEVANAVLKQAGLDWPDIAAVHLPASRRDLMSKLLRALDFDPARSNLGYLARHGDLSAASPYVHVSALGHEPWLGPGDHLLMLTQGTGMTWSAMVLRR